MTKKGLREFDCREAVAALEPDGSSLLLLLHHTVPAVRPDDVLTGLHGLTGLVAGEAPLLTRLEQGRLDPETGRLLDPLG